MSGPEPRPGGERLMIFSRHIERRAAPPVAWHGVATVLERGVPRTEVCHGGWHKTEAAARRCLDRTLRDLGATE